MDTPRLVATLVSVNVGRPRETEWRGRLVRSAIWKEPVAGPVEVRAVNVSGDEQADRRVHGGVHKAVYAYAAEDYAWWSERLGIEIAPATFGENLTVAGFDLREAWVGERWRVGTCLLEVSEPRMPCFKLGMRMGTADFVELFGVVGRHGTYLRIIEEGTVEAGDAVEVVSRPREQLTVAELAASRHSDETELLERVADHPHVSANWAKAAQKALRRSEPGSSARSGLLVAGEGYGDGMDEDNTGAAGELEHPGEATPLENVLDGMRDMPVGTLDPNIVGDAGPTDIPPGSDPERPGPADAESAAEGVPVVETEDRLDR